MDPVTAVANLITEILKTFNAAQANRPPDQVKTEALVMWGMIKPILKLFLTSDQIKQLAAEGVNL